MSSNKLTSEGAMRAFMAVELMRSTGEREFPAQLMSIFFWIAAHDGCRQEDLAQECNISYKAFRLFLTPKGKVLTKNLDNYSKQAFADFTKAKEDLKSHDDEDLG